MFKTYFLIALRRLWRERIYAGISVFSFATAMASIILIGTYIIFEINYDKHNVNYEHIYRVISEMEFSGSGELRRIAQTPENFGALFTKDFPQVGTSVSFAPLRWPAIFNYQNIAKTWTGIYYVDPSVFSVFTFDVIYGDISLAFAQPQSIAISDKFAEYYFGDVNPIGSALNYDGTELTVTLVYKELPENSHLRYSALLPMQLRKSSSPFPSTGKPINLNLSSTIHYLMLSPNFPVNSFSTLSREFIEQYDDDNSPQAPRKRFILQPLANIHLQSDGISDGAPQSSLTKFFGLSAIGLLVVIIGCINTVNLSTARASQRFKELSMLRLLGASRLTIAMQSLTESLALALIALFVGVALVEIYGAYSPIRLLNGAVTWLSWKERPFLLLTLLVICIAISFLVSLYPAWHLAQTSSSHSSSRYDKNKNNRVRTTLVGLQLFLAIAGCAGTFLLFNQIRYLSEKDLGYSMDNRLEVFVGGSNTDQILTRLQTEFSQLPEVVDVSRTTWAFNGGMRVKTGYILEGQSEEGKDQIAELIVSDQDLAATLDMHVVIGSDFSDIALSEAKNSVLINQTLAKKIAATQGGLETLIGSQLKLFDRTEGPRIIGVVKDFHLSSLRSPIESVIVVPADLAVNRPLISNMWKYSHLIVNFDAKDTRAFIEKVKKIVETHNPGYPPNIQFLSDSWNKLYGSETEALTQVSFFAGVSILLCFLGLLGLAAFNAEARGREMSVRKAIGASTASILGLFGKPFIVIGLIATIPAWIIVYYLVNKWLQNFAYHVDISFYPFIIATIAVILVALATVISQCYKTAQRNPAEVLRYE